MARRLSAWSIAACLLGAAIQPAPASVLREFGEWAIACDQIGRCSILNVGPLARARMQASPATGRSRVCVHREPGADRAPTIHLTLREVLPRVQAAARQPRFLRVARPSGPSADIPLANRGAEQWEVPPVFVPTLVSALVDGGDLLVLAPDGRLVERIGTDGIGEALTLAEERQGRPLGVSPPARGGDARPEALVTAALSPTPSGQRPSAASLALRQAACGAPGLDRTTGYRLLGDRARPDRTLWVTPCDAPGGPPRAFFVIENEDGSSAPVVFPGRDATEPRAAAGMIGFPGFRPDRGVLREAWHAPAPPKNGEACLVERLWAWTGRAFELAEERRSLACVGSGAVWRAVTFSRPLTMAASAGEPATAAASSTPCEGPSR